MKKNTSIVPLELIENKIYLIRGKKVMIDRDLAVLYGVTTKVLNQAVRRNILRFPEDFMFQLVDVELENLRSQFVTSSYGGRRYKPYVFTEQGVAMLSSVLKSERAIIVNIQIMRTFSRLRTMIEENDGLRLKLEAMEKQYDEHFKVVFEAMRRLLKEDQQPAKEIGFQTKQTKIGSHNL